SLIRQALRDADESRVEELRLVDPDDFRSVVDLSEELLARSDRDRRHPHLAVRNDLGVRESGIDRRLEDLDALFRDDHATQPTDELFALAREHAAADHLDPAELRLDEGHGGGSYRRGAEGSRREAPPKLS